MKRKTLTSAVLAGFLALCALVGGIASAQDNGASTIFQTCDYCPYESVTAGDFDAANFSLPVAIPIYIDGTLSVGTGAATLHMPYAMTLTAVRIGVGTAPAGADLQVDVNEAGTTVFSTELTIDDGEATSTTAATAAVLSDTSLADGAAITVDVVQVGSGTAGADAIVWLIGTR